MFYAFDPKTHAFQFTIDKQFEDMSEYLVIESDAPHSIMDVCVVVKEDGTFELGTREPTKEELVILANNKRSILMDTASHHISILSDIVEMSESEVDAAKLAAWKRFRITVYKLDTSNPQTIVWPEMPTREV